MRLLIGYIIEIPEIISRRPIPGREAAADEILAFGNSYTHIAHEPGLAWTELIKRCPSGWTPDVYLHISPEYNPIPDDVANADCMTVAVFGDWNLGGQAIRNAADAFDVLIADKPGGERLRNAGYPCVRYAPIWAQNPETHHILRNPNSGPVSDLSRESNNRADRDIDVLMLGNMNHSVQWERAPWLARVARLSRRYDVLINSGVFGDDYTRTMNRAKIVFNRSIRGELNMRAFEAPACGALMFYEDSNPEVRDIFTDRVDCVLYNSDNLETLLDYYLATENRAEREQIAAAGWRRVQDHSYTDHFRLLLEQIDPLLSEWQSNPASRRLRPFAYKSTRTQRMRTSHQWLNSCNTPIHARLSAALELEQRHGGANVARFRTTTAALPVAGTDSPGDMHNVRLPDSSRQTMSAVMQEAELANLRAAALASWGNALIGAPERNSRFAAALTQGQKAISLDRSYTLALINLAYVSIAAGRPRDAESFLLRAVDLLDSNSFEPSQLRGAVFPRRFDFIDVELERIWFEHEPESPQWGAEVRRVMGCRVHVTLSELAFADGRYSAAKYHAERAAANLPNKPEPRCFLASARRALGCTDAAIEAFTAALRANPFLFGAREELARLYLDIERPADALALIDDWAAITAGCPFYAPVSEPFDRLRAEVVRNVSRSAARVGVTVKRLLALPDWRIETGWKEIVQAFVSANRPSDPVQLMMRIDPEEYPDPRPILARLQNYLLTDLGIGPGSAPNITLVNQALAPDQRWKLFHVADAVVTTGDTPAVYRDLIEASELPIYHTERFRTEGLQPLHAA